MSQIVLNARRILFAALAVLMLSGFALAGPLSSKAEAYPRYCTTKHPDRNTTITTCVQITQIYGRKFNVVYRDGVRNPEKGSASLNCTATTSKTFSWHLDASVKAEAGAIFAKVSGEISGGISHSVTTGYSTSASKSVPGKKTLFCDRGVYTYKFKGVVDKVVCSNANCSSGTRKFKGDAPSRALWNLYIGH